MMMRKQNDMTMYMFLAVVLIIFVLAGVYFGSNITEDFTQYSFLEEKPIVFGASRIRDKEKSPGVAKPRPPASKLKKEVMKPISTSPTVIRQRSRFLGIF